MTFSAGATPGPYPRSFLSRMVLGLHPFLWIRNISLCCLLLILASSPSMSLLSFSFWQKVVAAIECLHNCIQDYFGPNNASECHPLSCEFWAYLQCMMCIVEWGVAFSATRASFCPYPIRYSPKQPCLKIACVTLYVCGSSSCHLSQ